MVYTQSTNQSPHLVELSVLHKVTVGVTLRYSDTHTLIADKIEDLWVGHPSNVGMVTEAGESWHDSQDMRKY